VIRPLLLGHRGARRHAPENTFAAFDLALAHGCDGFEFDVRCTSDGRGVICHDPKLGRITVARTPFDKLREREAMLPCLSEVLQRYATRAFLDIEFKVAGAEDELLDALRRWPPQRGFVVSSFLPEILRGVRRRDAELPLGLIADKARALRLWRKLDVQYVMAHHSLVTPALVKALREAEKKVFVWTVNEARALRQFANLGVDALISDDTELLGHTFERTERRGTA
jgi:glycerophosphoryl diester phosphodiesterase